jgi:phage repressor protein C with HTH and peptisase S24 domain
MLTHSKVWNAIDALARRYGLSASGLAKRAGLDATAFNRSKRVTGEGRPRWPTTESLAKVLDATGASLEDFVALVRAETPGRRKLERVGILVVRLGGADLVPTSADGEATVVEEAAGARLGEADERNGLGAGESMQPLYWDGGILVVSPNAGVRKGDRVVLRTTDGEVMAKVLVRRTVKTIELASVNPAHPNLVFPVDRIDWIARIVWESQ